jgi:hypothetical protein
MAEAAVASSCNALSTPGETLAVQTPDVPQKAA